VIDINRIQFS